MDLGTRGKLVVLVCEVLQNMVVTIIVNNPLSRLTSPNNTYLFSWNQHLLLDKPWFHISSQSHFYGLDTKTKKLKNNNNKKKIGKLEPNSEYNSLKPRLSLRIPGMTGWVTYSLLTEIYFDYHAQFYLKVFKTFLMNWPTLIRANTKLILIEC